MLEVREEDDGLADPCCRHQLAVREVALPSPPPRCAMSGGASGCPKLSMWIPRTSRA
jgi:hypothetical protein